MHIKELSKLVKITNQLKEQWKKIVLTSWCFDIIHPGHIRVFEESKKLGDVLVVAVNGDQSPYWELKNGASINNEEYRAIMLDSIKYIDYVIFFQEITPLETIQDILPDIIVKGWDYGPKNYWNENIYDVTKEMKELIEKWENKISKERKYIVASEEVINNGGKVMVVPLLGNYSSSKILKKNYYNK